MNITFEINNKRFFIEKKYNILQVCEKFNIDIPKFCYHEKLSIAGNCRMCLVEVKGSLKPVASCALPISNNMVVFTNSKLVKKAREGILEFILLNHPLDCPICDQGGECDLQDQTIVYGNDRGRFYDYKKTALDKDCGFLIKTVMTRCIQCTRCIRFFKEIAGINSLGLINRGYSMEISTFINKVFNSEVSGNVIDLCPVGALTSNPYSFIARPWELKNFNTIDLNDNLLSNIRVDVRNTEILRIIPRFNKNLNDFWISDITRFSFDGFKYSRILYPFLKKDNSLLNISWFNVIYFLKKNIGKKINFILGNFLDLESIFLVKQFSTKYADFTINSNKFFSKKNINNDFRNNFLMNLNINDLKLFKKILIIGLNLRLESPLLNIFFKDLVNKNLLKIYNIGSAYNYNYYNYNFGNNPLEIYKFFEGKSFLNNIFKNSNEKNLILIGNSFLNRNDFFTNIFDNFFYLNKKNFIVKLLNIYNTNNIINELNLLNNISKFSDISLSEKKQLNLEKNNLLYLMNTDSIFFNKINAYFIIYQGHHNFKLNNLFFKTEKNNFLILPTLTFFEKSGIFLNFLGVFQKTKLILTPPLFVRNDWKILNIFYNIFTNKVLYKNLSELRFNAFKNYNIFLNNFINSYICNAKNLKKYIFKINNVLMLSSITNLNLSNQILKASKILNLHSNSLKKKYSNFI